jgi:hypothetical protein
MSVLYLLPGPGLQSQLPEVQMQMYLKANNILLDTAEFYGTALTLFNLKNQDMTEQFCGAISSFLLK